jgi:hypothetical protein
MLWEEQTRDAPTKKKKSTLQKSCHTTLIAHTIQGREAHRPPSGTAIPTYHRSQTSHNAARPSHPQPKLHRKTARRPRPPHRHPGPPPRPKSHTTSPEGRRPSRQPRRTSDTRLPPNPCQQLLRPMKQLPNMVSEAAASTRKSSPRGRCPDIHRHVDNRRNKASSPRRCLQEGNDVAAAIARPETRSLGFLPESHNHRGCRRSSTASVSKKKNDAGAPPLPAPTRSVLGFRPEHLHTTPRTGRPSLLLSTATKHQHSHLVSITKTSCPRPQPRNLLPHADEPASRGTSSQDHRPCLLAAASHRCGAAAPPSSACNTRCAASSSSRACTRPKAPPPPHDDADRRTKPRSRPRCKQRCPAALHSSSSVATPCTFSLTPPAPPARQSPSAHA